MNDMTGGFPVDAAVAANFRLLQDVDVKLTVEIGSTSRRCANCSRSANPV